MSLSSMTSAQVTRLIKLLKKKEKLSAVLSTIEDAVMNIESGVSSAMGMSAPKRRGRKPGRKPGRPAGKAKVAKAAPVKRGRKPRKLKPAILAALTAAGPKGISISDISKKLGVKPGNVFSWVYTTGKKVKGLKKTGPGHYTLTPSKK